MRYTKKFTRVYNWLSKLIKLNLYRYRYSEDVVCTEKILNIYKDFRYNILSNNTNICAWLIYGSIELIATLQIFKLLWLVRW